MLKPSIIFVLGPPGSGKGTQCEILSNVCHLSAGELLRRECDKKGPHSLEIEVCMKEGKIVPVEITLKLLNDEMKKIGYSNVFLIDGFPRNDDNLNGYLKFLHDKVNLCAAIWLDVQEKTSVSRILRRSQSLSRIDDNPVSLSKRWQLYNEISKLLSARLQPYCPIIHVNAEKSLSEVAESIEKALSNILTPI